MTYSKATKPGEGLWELPNYLLHADESSWLLVVTKSCFPLQPLKHQLLNSLYMSAKAEQNRVGIQLMLVPYSSELSIFQRKMLLWKPVTFKPLLLQVRLR